MKRIHFAVSIVLSMLLLILVPGDASAYVGPGAGLTVIGSALAAVAGVLLAIVGFVWYPIKRLLRTRKGRAAGGGAPERHS